jgi:hypothetical protein
LLAVFGATHWLSGFDLAQRAELGRVRAGETQSFDNDTARLGLVGLVGLIVTATAWFVWLHRAVSNAWALGRQTRFTPGWSVGWWFVPFANLVRPYQIVRSLADELVWTDAPVLWWWASYIGAGAISNIASRIQPTDVAGFRLFVGSFLAADLLRIVAGVLAIWLIAGIERQMDVVAGAQPTVPPEPQSPSTQPVA